eukprot:367133_1
MNTVAFTKRYKIIIAATIGSCGFAGYYSYNFGPLAQNNKLIKLQKLFENGNKMNSPEMAKGICGRVKCLMPNAPHWDNDTMSAPHQPFSWIIGCDGLYELSQCENDYDKLILLGHSKDWIKRRSLNIDKDRYFNLYLFPQKSNKYNVIWANWDGIFQLLLTTSLPIYNRIKKFKEELKTLTFDEIEQKAGFIFHEIGYRDSRFMTKEKFLSMNEEDITIVDVRFFFYCYMCVSKYFKGDGYTVTKDGKIGCKEYWMENIKLSDIDKIKTVKLNVDID